MKFTQFQGNEPYHQCVESLFHFEGYTPEHSIEKIIPDGSINLIFELDGMARNVLDNESHKVLGEFRNAWLSGVHRNFISISVESDAEMFVIRFNPGGLFPFVTQPVSEFTDHVIAADEVFGNEIIELRSEFLNAGSAEEMNKAAQRWLATNYNESRLPKSAIRKSIEKIALDPRFHNNNLDVLIEESGYSQKQFIKLFRDYVGVTPKYFQRIKRFSELLEKLQNKEELSWADISYECGFSDQAHFIKEFQHFCGRNPSEHIEMYLSDERTNFFPDDQKPQE